MHKLIGFGLFVAGGLLLSFAIGRYATGWWRQEEARAAWDRAEARAVVALARSEVEHHRAPETIANGQPVARLTIPAVGLDEIVLEGVDGDELNAAPGHLPGSAYPGEPGNAIISAHRDRQFDHLDAVDVGDTLHTESGWHETDWIVVSKRVVAKDAPALFATAAPTLTLTTCWPIRFVGSAPDRLIITARPIRPAAQARVARRSSRETS